MTILLSAKPKKETPVCWVCGPECAFGKPAEKGKPLHTGDPHLEPDLRRKCECGRKGVLPASGLCEACTYQLLPRPRRRR